MIEEVEEEMEEKNFGHEDLIDLGDLQEEGKEGINTSLHAIIESPNPKTMRVVVKLSGHNFVALIDTGSTHNFIHPRVAKRVGMKVLKHKAIGVNIVDGSRLWSEGSCSDIKLMIQGYQFVTRAYVIQLRGCDMVLGIIWPILWDFSALKMEFQKEGKRVLICGMGVEKSEVDYNPTFLQELRRVKEGLILQIWELGSIQNEIPEHIENLLLEFVEVFQEPKGIPPSRSHDHSIVLKEGTSPISVRPYKYPYYQKSEIEKLIKELLVMGTIRPSQSPFSSSILLVRKADGSWRMCVDYRALNKETVKDKFPIPVVKELLDELHGSQSFSKLDLRSGFHQIRMKEEVPKTAFRTHKGHYEFPVMPFGLTNAPSTFQGLINDIF